MKLIKFYSEPQYQGLGQPQPTKLFIPEWYRKSESTFSREDNDELAPGLKKCMPYMDSLVSGYVLTTPVNVYVNEKSKDSLSALFNDKENDLQIRWDGPHSFNEFIGERPPELGSQMPRPEGHYPNHLAFRGVWGVKVPRGYSLLVTHPFNRFDLPFTITSAIIDSDHFFTPGNIPFFMKRGFSGMIPQGTPFAQLLPVKRDSWKMILNDPGMADQNKIQSPLVRNKGTEYKKVFWQRKKYD